MRWSFSIVGIKKSDKDSEYVNIVSLCDDNNNNISLKKHLFDPGKKLIFIFRGLLFKFACIKITL